MATRKKATQETTKTPVKKEVIIKLSKEQYSELRSISRTDIIDEIEELGIEREDDLKSVGFALGKIYSDLKTALNKMENILDEVEPENYYELEDEDIDFDF